MESGRPGAVMIRFGELFLKSEPVRRQFMKTLIQNIRVALSAYDPDARISESRGRIFVQSEEISQIIPIISHIFGVVGVAPSYLTEPSVQALSTLARDLGLRHLKSGMSFAIRARRDQVSGFTSQELGAKAGSAVMGAVLNIRVDLTKPDYEIFLEARKEGGIAYDTHIPGPGGLPYGTQGSLTALLSAGIDSPVAAWLMMKRGVKVSFLHINTGRYAGSDCMENVMRNLAALSVWTPGIPLKMRIINAEPFFDRLMADAQPRYRCVLCKRGMLRMAELYADEKGVPGIITGDNLGQVATQTLQNIVTISSGVKIQILRPLIGYDKNDIIELARKIGTFSQVPGDTSCGVLPSKPATTSVQGAVETMESDLRVEEILGSVLNSGETIQAMDGAIHSE